jgi:hypothetical protein
MASEPATPRQIGMLHGLYGAVGEKYTLPGSKVSADLELRRLTQVKDARAVAVPKRARSKRRHGPSAAQLRAQGPASARQIAALRELHRVQDRDFVMPANGQIASATIVELRKSKRERTAMTPNPDGSIRAVRLPGAPLRSNKRSRTG